MSCTDVRTDPNCRKVSFLKNRDVIKLTRSKVPIVYINVDYFILVLDKKYGKPSKQSDPAKNPFPSTNPFLSGLNHLIKEGTKFVQNINNQKYWDNVFGFRMR